MTYTESIMRKPGNPLKENPIGVYRNGFFLVSFFYAAVERHNFSIIRGAGVEYSLIDYGAVMYIRTFRQVFIGIGIVGHAVTFPSRLNPREHPDI